VDCQIPQESTGVLRPDISFGRVFLHPDTSFIPSIPEDMASEGDK
jgi:hypothetical protein